VAPALAGIVFGVDSVPALRNRFEGLGYDEALAAFAQEPRVRVLLEQGAATGEAPGTPAPRSVAEFGSWPVEDATTRTWFLADGGRLRDDGSPDAPGTDDYRADPDAVPATSFEGGGDEIWRADAAYDWPALAPGTGLGFTSDPFDRDVLLVGSGSLDLWISADADDTDLEVTVTEVRPDGQEVYVQSGWLRASHRALDETASTALRPVQTHLEADAEPLPAGELTPVRVEVFPFAHPFRRGSRLRVTIDAPGGNRPVWSFDSISSGETVTVAHGGDTPSRLVLGEITDVAVPGPAPACGALRAQPCRTYAPAANGG
jgi:putative CocE/NonD family hydrolase